MPTTTTGRGARSEGNAQVWTMDAIRALGATTDVETAAAILGIGRTKAYALAKAGQFPVRLLRVGRRYLVPVPAILKVLGVE
jgi:helix-turn-helix protein